MSTSITNEKTNQRASGPSRENFVIKQEIVAGASNWCTLENKPDECRQAESSGRHGGNKMEENAEESCIGS